MYFILIIYNIELNYFNRRKDWSYLSQAFLRSVEELPSSADQLIGKCLWRLLRP